MKVAVLGGAGYIGSHCVKMMCDKGYEVVVVDNLITGFVKAVDKRATFYECNIKNEEELTRIFKNERVEAVVHFAALSLVGVSMIEPLEYYNNNVYGTEIVLRAMNNTNIKHIVFSSTAATFGSHDIMQITEDYDQKPTNTYGETKLAMEKMMKWVDIAHGIKSITLRYFNVAGAHESGTIGEAHNPETHLIPLILQVPNGKRDYISIFGTDYDTHDGTCIRDYVHVEDLINAHILSLEYVVKTNESNHFNLGSGEGYSVLEMIEAARRVTSHEIPAKIESRRAGDPDKLIASSDKIEKVLGWKRKYETVEQIIESAWKFHSTHKKGYEE